MKKKDDNTLFLSLRQKWWNMIGMDEKKQEYREVTTYWASRLLDNRYDGLKRHKEIPTDDAHLEKWLISCLYDKKKIGFRPFKKVVFRLGYTKRTMTFRLEKISVGTGKEEWGAMCDRNYFIITLGERIE